MINTLQITRKITQNYIKYFKELLENNNEICNHHGNIQTSFNDIFNSGPFILKPLKERIL